MSSEILNVFSYLIYYHNRAAIPGDVTALLDVDNMDVEDTVDDN